MLKIRAWKYITSQLTSLNNMQPCLAGWWVRAGLLTIPAAHPPSWQTESPSISSGLIRPLPLSLRKLRGIFQLLMPDTESNGFEIPKRLRDFAPNRRWSPNSGQGINHSPKMWEKHTIGLYCYHVCATLIDATVIYIFRTVSSTRVFLIKRGLFFSLPIRK